MITKFAWFYTQESLPTTWGISIVVLISYPMLFYLLFGKQIRLGPRLNINIIFPEYMVSQYKDEAVVRPSYLYNGNAYTDNILYWDCPQNSERWLVERISFNLLEDWSDLRLTTALRIRYVKINIRQQSNCTVYLQILAKSVLTAR